LAEGTKKAQEEGDSLPSFTPKSGAEGAASIPLEYGKPNGAGVDEAEIAWKGVTVFWHGLIKKNFIKKVEKKVAGKSGMSHARDFAWGFTA
jgi:hypothetical protein